jgi:ABC-type sugar transport system ATPase subunit
MRGIRKAFAGTVALAGVDIDLAAGEVHVLAGENGAGKSTLIKILAGVYPADAGQVWVAGRPVRLRSPHDAARHGIAAIHQEMSLIGPMSVADNIFLGRELTTGGWTRPRRQHAQATALLGQLGLEIAPEQAVESYPIAVQQQVEIAKALTFAARVLIMDEPTSALSEPEVERLFRLIETLKARGCGILYISHKMEEIYRVADRITVLRDGARVGTASRQELPPAELIRWMVGREISQQFPRRTVPTGAERLSVRELTVPHRVHGLPPLVDRVSFAVRAGEIVGLAGLQGSGASELLQGLFGAVKTLPTGEVRVDGQPVRCHSPRQALKQGLALLTADRKTGGLVPGLSLVHNLTLAALPRFSPWGWLRPRRETAAAQAHSTALRVKTAALEQDIAELSGGNQQKVLLARWQLCEPRIYLLDEPTRGIDVGAKHDVYELMNRWTAAGCAILLITSEMPELLALADRIVVLHRGRVTATFPRAEATQDRILRAAMGEVETTPTAWSQDDLAQRRRGAEENERGGG